jgi:CheY-like chemotaxis protein
MIASQTIFAHQPQLAASNLHLLIVDDDPGDIELMRIAFGLCTTAVCIDSAADGLHAIQLLRRAIAECQRPALILLDLNMPRMDGCEVIARMRQEGLSTGVPIVMLSKSREVGDEKRCLKAGACAFHTKPDSVEGLVDLARMLSGYLA